MNLNLLRTSPAQHVHTPWKLAIVTGLSDPITCQLSDSQLRFLARITGRLSSEGLEQVKDSVLSRNFPYLPAMATGRARPGLLRASIANYRHYRACRTKRYNDVARPHWLQLFNSADNFYIIAGSCGLELVLRGLQCVTSTPPIRVLALGPVASRLLTQQMVEEKRIELRIIYGACDRIATSRLFHDAVRVPNLSHLGYWADERVERLTCEWLMTSIL